MNPMMNNMNNNIQFQQQQQMMQFQMQQQKLAAQQAQNQMQNIIQDQNNNFQQHNKVNLNQTISIYFRGEYDSGEHFDIIVQCKIDEKVSDAIEKYRNESNDRDMKKKFIFNAKPLHPSLKLIEAGLSNNCSVFVVDTKGLMGG